jgi:predicted amino acid dehydrogenase
MGDGASAKTYLVECFWPGVTRERLITVARRAHAGAAALHQQGRDVSLLGSILVLADETVFCIFEGAEDDVRTVADQMGLRYERVLESLTIDGPKE